MPLIRILTQAAVLCLITVFSCHGQGIKGRITDNKQAPIPFAVVYDETTRVGTTCNADGYYELKLEPGSHSLVYKAMGYNLVRKTIQSSLSFQQLSIEMLEQPVALAEVVITPGKEDPAYAIMRKVIGLAPYHLNQVKGYDAEVYLRGTIHIIKMPKFIAKHTSVNGATNVLKTGDVYVEESVNQIRFKAPDQYEQKVTSIHSTFPWNNTDINPMGIINSSLYEPEIDEFISPLAPKAFNFYTFRYEGFFNEGEQVVFKIRVTPKRDSQQLMRGTIYIVDRLWCLHSVEVAVNMFFGKLAYKIMYSPVKSNAWLPVSYQFNLDAAIMGIKATYKYASSVKFKQVELNERMAKTQGIPTVSAVPETGHKQPEPGKTDPRKVKQQQEIESLLAKDDLSNRDMMKLATLMAKEAPKDSAEGKTLEIRENSNKVTVDKDAVKNDTAYWSAMRPIPLTAIESLVVEKKDSTLKMPGDTLAAADTTKKKKTPEWISKSAEFVFSGADFRAFDSTLYVKYEGLIGLKKVDFNTVDGFLYRQSIRLEQRIDSTHNLKVNAGIAYAFNRQKWMWQTDVSYAYAPMRGGNVRFHIGSESADYNGETGINSTLNSITSLFLRRNYQKLYQQNHAFLTNRIDLANGFTMTTTLGFQATEILDNHSDYSFFYRDERAYTPNLADTSVEWTARNLGNKSAYWEIALEFTPRYYYRVRGGTKQYQHSRWPTFYLWNKMAVPGIAGSSASYNLTEIGIRQRKEWGMMHSFAWDVKGGFFLQKDKIYTTDDKYFNNQYFPVAFGNTRNSFRLLPYYNYHTTSDYAEAHVTFTTPYLFVKYLPFLSNKLWVENLHLNYLTTSQQKHYWEAGYSISQIYMVGSIGIFAGFNGTRFHSYGVQAAIDF